MQPYATRIKNCVCCHKQKTSPSGFVFSFVSIYNLPPKKAFDNGTKRLSYKDNLKFYPIITKNILHLFQHHSIYIVFKKDGVGGQLESYGSAYQLVGGLSPAAVKQKE